VWPLAATAQTSTVWIVLLVTTDRFIAVCRPFEARWRSVERTRLAVVVVLGLSVVYNLPQWFERDVVWDTDSCTGLTYGIIKKVSSLSWHSTTPTPIPTRTSSPTSSRRIVARMSACRSACHRNNFRTSRVGRVGDDPREGVGVGVGVVEFQLYAPNSHRRTRLNSAATFLSCLRIGYYSSSSPLPTPAIARSNLGTCHIAIPRGRTHPTPPL